MNSNGAYLKNQRILIVDDQIFNLDAMMIILKHSIKIKDCHRVCDCVYDGQQALDKVIDNCFTNQNKRCDYKLILMDLNMPNMDGYQATIKIREFLSLHNIEQPTIVAVTGHCEQTYLVQAQNSGLDLVLSKPIQIEQLRSVFKNLSFETENQNAFAEALNFMNFASNPSKPGDLQ